MRNLANASRLQGRDATLARRTGEGVRDLHQSDVGGGERGVSDHRQDILAAKIEHPTPRYDEANSVNEVHRRFPVLVLCQND